MVLLYFYCNNNANKYGPKHTSRGQQTVYLTGNSKMIESGFLKR